MATLSVDASHSGFTSNGFTLSTTPQTVPDVTLVLIVADALSRALPIFVNGKQYSVPSSDHGHGFNTEPGPPPGGTWQTGDTVVDVNSSMWVCTAGGSPGSWVQSGGGTPSYAGTRSRPYDVARNVYGGDTVTRRPVRQALAKALTGTTLVPIVFAGDSETISWKSNLGVTDQVTQFRNLIKAMGYPVTGGWIMPGAGFPDSTHDSRISTTGTWAGFNTTVNNYVWSTVTSSSLTFTFDLPGTIVEFALAATTTHNVSYQIDGGTVQTASAIANVVTQFQTTGLANTTHTLTITLSSGTITWVCAARCRQTVGVSISNMGIFGSKATDWAPTANSSAVFNPYKMAFSALEAPALAIVGLGANDSGTATQAALEAAVMAVITPAKVICPVVINGYNPIDDAIFASGGNAAYPNMAALALSEYNIADASGCMLIDHNNAMGTNAELVTAGLAYSDQRHLLPPGYADVALRNVQALLI